MIVSEAIFYSSIISWVLYWWFIGNITKKVGMLVVPLTLPSDVTFMQFIWMIPNSKPIYVGSRSVLLPL